MGIKTFVWGGYGIGATVGGFIPMLWDSSLISFSGLIWSTVGGMVGIYIGYKVGKGLGG
jgi:hypothetical protein